MDLLWCHDGGEVTKETWSMKKRKCLKFIPGGESTYGEVLFPMKHSLLWSLGTEPPPPLSFGLREREEPQQVRCQVGWEESDAREGVGHTSGSHVQLQAQGSSVLERGGYSNTKWNSGIFFFCLLHGTEYLNWWSWLTFLIKVTHFYLCVWSFCTFVIWEEWQQRP